MSLIKLASRLIKGAFIVDDWRARGRTTLFEALIILGVSSLVFWSGVSAASSAGSSLVWFKWAIASVFMGAILLLLTRLARIPFNAKGIGDGKFPVQNDKELEWRQAGEGHEFVMSITSILICLLIVSAFKLLELSVYQILEFLQAWW